MCFDDCGLWCGCGACVYQLTTSVETIVREAHAEQHGLWFIMKGLSSNSDDMYNCKEGTHWLTAWFMVHGLSIKVTAKYHTGQAHDG